MKRVVLNTLLALTLIVSVTSCRETEEKKTEVEVKTEKEAEGRLEAIGKSMDGEVDNTKEAGKAVKEVVEEIDTDDN